MDKMSKLSLLISTLAVAGLLAGDLSAMSRSEYATVREFVERGDVNGLRNFLALSPELMDNSPLGQELAAFMDAPQGNIFERLGLSKKSIPNSLAENVSRNANNFSIY